MQSRPTGWRAPLRRGLQLRHRVGDRYPIHHGCHTYSSRDLRPANA